MKLVVDANRVISALIRDGSTRRALLLTEATLFAPTFLLEELHRHRDMLLKRSRNATPPELEEAIRIVTGRIRWVAPEETLPHYDVAEEALARVDEKDCPLPRLCPRRGRRCHLEPRQRLRPPIARPPCRPPTGRFEVGRPVWPPCPTGTIGSGPGDTRVEPGTRGPRGPRGPCATRAPCTRRPRGCERFVLISTDKAVEPSSVMGASKRLAEMVLFSGNGAMVRSAVRFGNVIGSHGSVIPIFERQLAHGGPLTVTHPDMERFFMMTSEAVSLVLQAAALGRGGDLFVLDMGKPVRVLEVAREFCRLKGFEPGVDVSIVFTGLRPGEKLVEVLHDPFEKLAPAGHERLLRADAGDIASPPGLLGEARGLVEAGDQDAARRCFERWFPSLRGAAEPDARAVATPLHPPAGR